MKPSKMKSFIIALSVLGFTQLSFGQCGTVSPFEQISNKDIDSSSLLFGLLNPIWVKMGEIQGDTYMITVPTVVHQVFNTSFDYYPKEDVIAGIDRINDYFAGVYADTSLIPDVFKPLVAKVRIQLKLAQIDPDGNPTDGIMRVLSELSTMDMNYDDANLKKTSQWDENRYYNIWLVNDVTSTANPGVIAYAYFPNGFQPWKYYGQVTPTSNWLTDETAAHEAGHTFGLWHTFQGSPACVEDCEYTGDYICDTPPMTARGAVSCDGSSSCSTDTMGGIPVMPNPFTEDVEDMRQNIMDYSSCGMFFTEQQNWTMRSYIDTVEQLKNLVSAQNLEYTKTRDEDTAIPSAPKALFYYNREREPVCTESSVTFTDLSYNTSDYERSWYFEGADITSSTDSIVTVTYSQQGIYDVRLVVYNTEGSDTLLLENAVGIFDDTTDLISNVLYIEDFEDSAKFTYLWFTGNKLRDKQWKRIKGISADGDYCLGIDDISDGSSGETVTVISPSYDLSTIENEVLVMDIAYARKQNDGEESFSIRYLQDESCTKSSWNTAVDPVFEEAEIVSKYTSSHFAPTADDWKTVIFPWKWDGLKEFNNIRFKFEYKTKINSNNIYIDNFGIMDANKIGLEEKGDVSIRLDVFPSPVRSGSKVRLNISSAIEEMSLSIYDLSGREVSDLGYQPLLSAGNHLYNLPSLTKGVYLLTMQSKYSRVTRRFVVL